MKKHPYIVGFAALALLLSLSAAHAEDASIETNEDAQVSQPTTSPLRVVPSQIRDRIREDIQERVQNLKNNQNTRNGLLEGRTAMPRPFGTTTADNGTTTFRRFDGAMGHATTTASTTFAFMRDGYLNNGRAMLQRIFSLRKQNVVRETKIALQNLTQIRGRIDSRIGKEEQAGKNMTDPRSLLAIADTKIQIAQDAVNAFASFEPHASTTATASTTVDLISARAMLQNAQSAVKDAQKALAEVVRSLMKTAGDAMPTSTTTDSQ